MKNYSHILLDWDGTLSKTLDVVLESYKTVFTEYGLHPSDEDIVYIVFGDWNGPAKVGIAEKDIDAFTEKLLIKQAEKYPYVGLYEGVIETLESIKSHNKILSLVTTTKRETIAPILKEKNLNRFFDLVLTSGDVKKHKPDPEIIHMALEKLGGSKDEAIIIGDSKSDLGAAQNAEIDSILFFPELNHRFYTLEYLKQYDPTYVVTEFKDILSIVLK